jgi:hypothetical protein
MKITKVVRSDFQVPAVYSNKGLGNSGSIGLVAGFAICLAFALRAPAAVLLQDSFGGLATSLRLDAAGNPVFISGFRPELSGIRAEIPGDATAVWTAPGGPDTSTWAFSYSSPDPFEQPSPLEPLGSNNGSATFQEFANLGADALLPFSPPSTAFEVALDFIAGSGGIAIGFSSSQTELTNNFASFGEIWLSVDGGFQGERVSWTLHSHGTNGPNVSGFTTLQGYNPLALAYDPVNKTARATLNGEDTHSISYEAVGIQAVGFEGSGTVDNFLVQTVSPFPPDLKILPLTFSGTEGVVVTWNAISNVTYRVQYTPDFGSAAWADLIGDVVAAGNTASKTDIRTATNRFYRVRVAP